MGAHQLQKVEGLPTLDQLNDPAWHGTLRLEGPKTKTRAEMLQWYQQLLKRPQSCSIVTDYSFGGSASQRYDFNNCLLTGYCLTCLEGSSSQECEETVTLKVEGPNVPKK